MTTVVLLIHLFLALALVITVLLQRSEGGALGIGGSPMGGFMTARGSANLLTRATAVLAALFMLTSIGLAIMADRRAESRSIVDAPAAPTQQKPAEPGPPTVPLAR